MRRGAFSLVELLVVVAIIAMLTGLLLPSLAGAREASRGAVCVSNARQLAAALLLYAGDHDDHAAPGAAEFRANLSRWHGSRESTGEAFEAAGGALTAYVTGRDASRSLRRCPTFAGALSRLEEAGRGFERSAGGYGYNNAFLGTRVSAGGEHRVIDDRVGNRTSLFAAPAATVTFTDAAFPDEGSPDRVIEYSFAEPRFHPRYGRSARMDPSVHFRHADGLASVVWLDGHADARPMTHSWSSGLYRPDASDVGIGWFGERDDNSLFDFDGGGR